MALAPVNNFSQFFEWNGNPLASEFGGNCIIKSQELLLRGLSDFDEAYFLREIKGPRCRAFYLRFLNVLDGYLYSVQYFLSSGKILISPTFTADLERVFVEARDLYREFKLTVNAK